MFVVVTVSQDDPYGAEWLVGPFADEDTAHAVGAQLERDRVRYARVRRVEPNPYAAGGKVAAAAGDDLFGQAIDGELHRMPTRQARVEWLALLAREIVHTVGALELPDADNAILAALAATRIQHAGRIERGDVNV